VTGRAHAPRPLFRCDECRRLHRGTERRVRLDRHGSDLGRGVFQGVLRSVRHRDHGTKELAKGAVAPLITYVVSRTLPPGKLRDVTVLGEDAFARIAELRAQPGKDIWLWGGGELFGSLAAEGLVDTVEVGVIPVLLGAGRKVMAGCDRRIKLIPRASDLALPGHTLLTYDVQKARAKRRRAA
jgi:dihydrofolate reductase